MSLSYFIGLKVKFSFYQIDISTPIPLASHVTVSSDMSCIYSTDGSILCMFSCCTEPIISILFFKIVNV